MIQVKFKNFFCIESKKLTKTFEIEKNDPRVKTVNHQHKFRETFKYEKKF